ncbi:MAG TPA: hypothetical protein ENK18_19345 [Deltaproteobacteria bacterium]|nr:hypothetical protein [Deltaproteobacteria bacterium]
MTQDTFDRELARMYLNTSWSQLLVSYTVPVLAAIVALLFPMVGFLFWLALFLSVAASASVLLRALQAPPQLRATLGPEHVIQGLAALGPVVFIGVPITLWLAYLLAVGALVQLGVL